MEIACEFLTNTTHTRLHTHTHTHKHIFHSLRRHDTACRVAKSVSHLLWVPCHACSNMADDEEAVVFPCTSLVFCALDLHESLEHLEKWGGHDQPSPRCGDAPGHVSCESRLSWRACRAVLSDKRDTAHHDFFLCQNAWARQRVVLWCDTWHNKWNLGFTTQKTNRS